jgi:TPP-dependent pyruvate/acetoin dehydrogenase alpha subunit
MIFLRSEKPRPSNEQMIHAYRSMLLTRLTDDRIDTLIKQGKATFLISGSGHEAIQVALAMAMVAGKDWFFTYYRDNAIGTALGLQPKIFSGTLWAVQLLHSPGKADANAPWR